MRSTEREITNIDEIDSLLGRAQVCRLALRDGDYPYIVPLCFGYSLDGGELELYFRSEEKGKKIDLLKQCSSAAFEIDELCSVTPSDDTYGFDEHYLSITGTGTVEFITGIDKITGYGLILKKYAGLPSDRKLQEQTLNSFAVLKLTAAEFCCKEHNPADTRDKE